jgi:hypothetical protein
MCNQLRLEVIRDRVPEPGAGIEALHSVVRAACHA